MSSTATLRICLHPNAWKCCNSKAEAATGHLKEPTNEAASGGAGQQSSGGSGGGGGGRRHAHSFMDSPPATAGGMGWTRAAPNSNFAQHPRRLLTPKQVPPVRVRAELRIRVLSSYVSMYVQYIRVCTVYNISMFISLSRDCDEYPNSTTQNQYSSSCSYTYT